MLVDLFYFKPRTFLNTLIWNVATKQCRLYKFVTVKGNHDCDIETCMWYVSTHWITAKPKLEKEKRKGKKRYWIRLTWELSWILEVAGGKYTFCHSPIDPVASLACPQIPVYHSITGCTTAEATHTVGFPPGSEDADVNDFKFLA